jgi:hypothetical protein
MSARKPKASNVIDAALSKAVQKQLDEISREIDTVSCEQNSARHLCVDVMANPSDPEFRMHGAQALLMASERRIEEVTRRINALRNPAP